MSQDSLIKFNISQNHPDFELRLFNKYYRYSIQGLESKIEGPL
jgi:hypothetical protein